MPLRKVCRRPETDYRLLQLHGLNGSATNQPKAGAESHTANTLRVYPPADKRPHILEEIAENTVKAPAAPHTKAPPVMEIKAQQLKVKVMVNTSTLGKPHAQPGNTTLQPKKEVVVASTPGILKSPPGFGAQQPKVAEIADTSYPGGSNVLQGNVVEQAEVTTSVNVGSEGDSNVLQSNVGQQQEAMEIGNDGNQENPNALPGDLVQQQPKDTHMVSEDTQLTSSTPPGNIIQQPDAITEMVSGGTPGNSNILPLNVIQQPETITETVSADILGISSSTPVNAVQPPEAITETGAISTDVGISNSAPIVIQQEPVKEMVITTDTWGDPSSVEPKPASEMVIDGTPGSSNSAPGTLIEQAEATMHIVGVPGNENVPEGNVV